MPPLIGSAPPFGRFVKCRIPRPVMYLIAGETRAPNFPPHRRLVGSPFLLHSGGWQEPGSPTAIVPQRSASFQCCWYRFSSELVPRLCVPPVVLLFVAKSPPALSAMLRASSHDLTGYPAAMGWLRLTKHLQAFRQVGKSNHSRMSCNPCLLHE
ncbi:hypothetical protein BDN67DRAFT_458746 [Paxillus ammoniavirescens]|nr:hypothetical protein BDN67DRAFT_458746 [Paxillus ammoniavirescens]